MDPITKIEASELLRLADNPAYRLYVQQLQRQFNTALAALLEDASVPEPLLRANIGVLSGLRTALTLPDTLIAAAKLQEELEKGNPDDDK